jgi:type IV pilus assembly protein PilY1
MLMNTRISAGLVAVAMLLGCRTAAAEDIDLFIKPSGTPDIPNVLFMIDNTANWNTAFTSEMSALVNAFKTLSVNPDGTAKYRVGVMFATETGNPNDNNSGAYVRAAIREMTGTGTATSTNYRALYAEMFDELDKNDDVGNAGKSALEMIEAYRYFAGGAPYAGNGKVKTDYTGNTGSLWKNGTFKPASKAAMQAIYALPGNALESKDGIKYTSPVPDGYCGSNYIIYISNGPNQQSSSDNAAANAALTAAGGSTAQLPISPTGSASNPSDEWARFMKDSMGVTVFTLDVYTDASKLSLGQWPGWTALLRSMASVTEGEYFLVNGLDTADLGNIIGNVLSRIQGTNSVFASVSLPVSVNNQSYYLNQVYIGMFRPDSAALPRWMGNLKQYKLGKVGNEIRTLDAAGGTAINSGTGFIAECARSFWTPIAADTYWAFKPQGDCTLSGVSYDNSNSPDGKVVEKGGQAYVLRSSTTRPLRTCASMFASCTTLADFNNTNVSDADLGVAGNTVERDLLIDWARGLDNKDEDIDTVTTAEMRPSVHGDVVHSRPVALNFSGNPALPKVVVFYGGNDGILRAVNGNRTADIGSVTAGQEMWAFMAPEFFTHIKRLRDNKVEINYKGSPTVTPTPEPKPYGMDGAITSYDNRWLFAGMRRGGRVLYAFDVSGIAASTPVPPTLKWKKGCPNLDDDDDCTAGFEDFGQTWSSARALKAAGYNVSGAGTEKPMLIMGGGYDKCEDEDPVSDTCKSGGKGNGIYVLDADTGAPLKILPTDRPVIGDIFVITETPPDDPDPTDDIPAPLPLAKWAYAADLGGNVYRISGADQNSPFDATLPGNWTIKKIASLGCATAASCTANRKFMFAPDVVEKDGLYYLLIGSGDREKPLDSWPSAYGTDNRFYMIKDKPTESAWLDDTCDTGDAAPNDKVICEGSLFGITTAADPSASVLADKKGWYLQLRDHEQAVTSAITVFGITTFSTHTPTIPVAGSCESDLGVARVYNVRYANAAAKPGNNNNRDADLPPDSGLPPSPVAGQVTLDDGSTYPFIIGADPASALEGSLPSSPSTGTQPKSLTYWYIQK